MTEILRKLKSRKLWLALGGLFAGVAMAFGVDSGELHTLAGAVTSVASVVVYILTEGNIDAAAIGTAAKQVQEAAETVTGHDGDENS
ncbi:hypothetical protein [Oscillibacter sp.]|uniref:hypothetical protein n=1 Tax=Oscillibacter sp. TaxID=1945593 RepID=UPI00261B983D|nr:hypothetical protein [Oscillibacter sp.]MDD3346814.1 hypothetical protein [Oscillibacter sp.]